MPDFEPPSPRAIVTRVLQAATATALVLTIGTWMATRAFPGRLAAFTGFLWAAAAFFTGLFDTLFTPLARFVENGFSAGPIPANADFDVATNTARLEGLMAGSLPRHRELLIGIRLAEIYRTHQHDDAKALALLERLRAKYPDAPELAHAVGD